MPIVKAGDGGVPFARRGGRLHLVHPPAEWA